MSPWDYAALDISRVFDRPLTRTDIQSLSEQDHQKIQTDSVLEPWSRSPLESAAIIVSLLQFAYNEDLEEIEESRLRWILRQALLREQIWQESARTQLTEDTFRKVQATQGQALGPMPVAPIKTTQKNFSPPTEAERLWLSELARLAVWNDELEALNIIPLKPSAALRSSKASPISMNHRPDQAPQDCEPGIQDGLSFNVSGVGSEVPTQAPEPRREGPKIKIR